MRYQVIRNFVRLSNLLPVTRLSQSRTIATCSWDLQQKSESDLSQINETESENEVRPQTDNNLPGGIATKYKVFRDEDSPIIFDVEEEMRKIDLAEINAKEQQEDIFAGINLERGVNGVYEIGDLVDILHRNNAVDVFVTSVPREFVYVDYIVIVSGKSAKHMRATADLVRRVYKKKRRSGDKLPSIEGKDSKEWMAMDLGNIALHIFSEKARKMYDLETLWSVGAKYDDHSNRPVDQLTEYLAEHSYLSGYQPAEVAN